MWHSDGDDDCFSLNFRYRTKTVQRLQRDTRILMSRYTFRTHLLSDIHSYYSPRIDSATRFLLVQWNRHSLTQSMNWRCGLQDWSQWRHGIRQVFKVYESVTAINSNMKTVHMNIRHHVYHWSSMFEWIGVWFLFLRLSFFSFFS